MCGEYLKTLEDFKQHIGSSPHVWGILSARRPGAVLDGSSPHVWGIRIQSHLWGIATSVHPHMCGEYVGRVLELRDRVGSSPHVWGILSRSCSLTYRRFIHQMCGELRRATYLSSKRRFIPTCVGNTFRRRRPTLARTVHPHMCGEYCFLTAVLRIVSGSSPHVWGILCTTIRIFLMVRFIPTCVGNTAFSSAAPSFSSVHPHMCGEYTLTAKRRSRIPRFIPTCVGNRSLNFFQHRTPGSSPHVWGIL